MKRLHEGKFAGKIVECAIEQIGSAETVEFIIMKEAKGTAAVKVTGPDGRPEQGSPNAADRHRFRSHSVAGKLSPSRNQASRRAREQRSPRHGGGSAAAIAPAVGIFKRAFSKTLTAAQPKGP